MTAPEWEIVKSLFLRSTFLSPRDMRDFAVTLQINERVMVLLNELLDQSESSGPRLTEPCWVRKAQALVTGRAFQIGERLLTRFGVGGFLGAGGGAAGN